MASNDNGPPPVSGTQQTSEPAPKTGDVGDESADTPASRRSPGRHTSVPSPSSVPHLPRQSSSTRLTSSHSVGPSPQTSRTTSPIRKDTRPSPLAANIATQPSAAAIQRALSATSVPQMQSGPVSEAVSRLPRSAKSVGGGSGDNTPQWSSSPRLKSPPPAANTKRGPGMTVKTAEQSAHPNITVQSATPQSASASQVLPKQQSDETRKLEQQLQAPAKAPTRGPSGKSTLETVQENSSDAIETSPAVLQAAADLKPVAETEEKVASKKSASEATRQPAESGSESAGNRSDSKSNRRQSTSRSATANSTPRASAKSSFSGLTSAKSRQGDGKPNMTVETETVASIPQSALSGLGDRSGMGRGEANGSLRLKPSNETIRPKKERKKTSQKSRSLNQGTASSKADIFEARVANAVDEANTSDSDETFVYESNPPEPAQRTRHHSRTPSVTSSHSTAEQRGGIRNFGEMLDDRKIAGKRSMKFSSNQHHEGDSPDSKTGTVRSHHARHIGKFGRSGAHNSGRESESPYTHASKPRSTHLGSMTSRPHSPRSPNPSIPRKPSGLFTRKHEQSFDFDGEGADDERTPLMGSMRTPRGARFPRRIHSGNSPQGSQYYGEPRRSRSCWGFGGCCLSACVFVGVAAITIFLLFMSNRPLTELKVRKMENVLATEEDVMLDLVVGAINPNALSVSVVDMDINVFASSKHLGPKEPLLTVGGTSSLLPSQVARKERRSKRRSDVDHRVSEDLSRRRQTPSASGGVDHGTDPIPDEGSDTQTLLLGRIFHFDVPLTFESQVFSRQRQYSTGTMQLMKPGNKTETGGSARWQRILLHSFELKVKGKLMYQLPVSMKVQSVAIEASMLVHPEEGIDTSGKMRIEPVKHDEQWQWIDWDSEVENEEETESRVQEQRLDQAGTLSD
nr:hypothetical protein CFP56_70093 [Quercus suber]